MTLISGVEGKLTSNNVDWALALLQDVYADGRKDFCEMSIGTIHITKGHTTGTLWIENKVGEGMGVDETLLEKVLDEWFEKVF